MGLLVKKTLVSEEDVTAPDIEGEFTFKVENTGAPVGVEAPMPGVSEITNSEAYESADKPGYYEFGNIEFAAPGEYTYKITELGYVPGVVNDSEAATGKTITFTVTDNGDGKLSVSSSADNAPLEFTNSYEVKSVSVTKVWADGDDQDGIRPDSLTLTLSDGQKVTLPGDDGGWTATIDNVPVYDEAGNEIEYTWTEEDVPEGYAVSYGEGGARPARPAAAPSPTRTSPRPPRPR